MSSRGDGRDALPILVAVHDPRHDGVSIGACANDEEDDHEEGLEVKERRLWENIGSVLLSFLASLMDGCLPSWEMW